MANFRVQDLASAATLHMPSPPSGSKRRHAMALSAAVPPLHPIASMPSAIAPVAEPPAKLARKQSPQLHDPQFAQVKAPTAFDEVRCELRPQDGAPALTKAALRTSGKLTIQLLAKFIHAMLNLDAASVVTLACCRERLTDAITLGHLVAHVWPQSDGHMVLDYRIEKSPDILYPP